VPSIAKFFLESRSRLLLLAVLTFLFITLLSFHRFGQTLENFGLDLLYASRATGPPPADLLIVGIDEPSFQEFRQAWPWPRSRHAALVRRLAAAGARLIVFDVVFADPTDAADDQDFTGAIRQAGNVILAQDLDIVKDPQFFRQILVEPYKPLRQAAHGLGLAKITPDADGVVRHFHLQVEGRDTLATAAVRAFRPALPLPPTGLIDYAGPPRSLDTVSYYQVVDPVHPLPAARIRGRIVLIGRMLGASPSPQAQPDTFYTPYYSTSGLVTSGVEIHGQIIHTLLSGDWGRELPATGRIVLYGIVILGAAYLMARLAPLAGLGFLAGLVLLILGISATLFLVWHYWAPPVLLTGGLAVLYSGNVLGHYLLEARERRWLRQAFGRYLSPSVVQVIVSHPERLQLGGEVVEGTVLFSDLAGFTSISENMAPADLIRLLNEYFSPLTEIILAQQGTLDKFIGDAIMAFWGAPLPLEDHAARACQAALAMQRAMAGLQNQWREKGYPSLRTRIGIHSGRLVVGNVGSRERFNYTVLGDTVNLASRLESVNKLYGTNAILSQDSQHFLSDQFLLRELDLVRVKGRAHPVTIYELLGPRGEAADLDWLEAFAAGRQAYQQEDWDRAEAAFQEVLHLKPDDSPSLTYLARIEHYRENPPSSGWQGIFILDSK
jgi:adenylate cyclase